MIEYDDNGYVIHEKLDREEALMFTGFLSQEKVRHQEDIDKIQSTLDYLYKKFPPEEGKECTCNSRDIQHAFDTRCPKHGIPIRKIGGK